MQEVPLVRLARKGSIGDRFLSLGAGVYSSGLGPRAQLLGAVGMEWEGERWVPGMDASIADGTERHRGLETRDRLAQLSVQLLLTQRLGNAALRAGPVVGGDYVRQQTTGHPDRASLGFSFGGRLRGDVQITRSVGVYVLADARWLALRLATDSGKELGVKPLYAATAGLRAGF
jgi:hypothetical protein